MKIAVIGATGHLGGLVAEEASARGHQVTALGRDNVDVTDVASIKDAVVGHDAVIVAVKGPDKLVPRAAVALLEALPLANVDKLAFLGGGGSLEYAPGQRFVDSPEFPAQYLETAQDQAEALGVFRASDNSISWTYASPPPAYLVPGDKTGSYRAEVADSPIVGADGEARISTGDYASAVLDAVEQGSFVHKRFTVGY